MRKRDLGLMISSFIIFASGFLIGLGFGQNTGKRVNRLISVINYQQKILVDTAENILSAWSLELRQHGDFLTSPCELEAISAINDDPRFTSWGVVDIEGNVVCTRQGVKDSINLADRPYVQRAIETKQMTMSGFQIGRITASRVIAYAYPLLDDQGQVEQVLFLGIDLEWMNDMFDHLDLPSNSELVITDPKGNVEVYYQGNTGDSGMIGEKIFKPKIFSIVLSQQEGTIYTKGLDNNNRKYIYGPVYLNKDETPDAFLLYGLPNRLIISFAPYMSILFVFLGLGLVFLQVWLGKKVFKNS
jgi:hypothetical protein